MKTFPSLLCSATLGLLLATTTLNAYANDVTVINSPPTSPIAHITDEQFYEVTHAIAKQGVNITSVSVTQNKMMISGKDAHDELQYYVYDTNKKTLQIIGNGLMTPVSPEEASNALQKINAIIIAAQANGESLSSANVDGSYTLKSANTNKTVISNH